MQASKGGHLSSYEKLVGVSLLIGLFLPHTSITLMMLPPFLCVILWYYNTKRFVSKGIQDIKFFLVASLGISCIINISSLQDRGAIVSFINLCLILITFPQISRVRIRNFFLYIALGYVFFSQIAFIFHINTVIAFIDRWYPISDEDWKSYSVFVDSVNLDSEIFTFRFGGVFRNSNQCAKYLCLISSLFYVENNNNALWRSIPFVGCAFIAILLTGSRTGLVIFALLTGFFFFSEHLSQTKKVGIICLVAVIIVILTNIDLGLRGLKVSEGLDDSVGAKFATFKYYLSSETDLLRLFFGHLDAATYEAGSNVISIFDSEYGYFVYNYGLIGSLIYAIFWVKLYRVTPRGNRYAFILLLWMVTSTILLAFRASFVMILAFSRFVVGEESHTGVNTTIPIDSR